MTKIKVTYTGGLDTGLDKKIRKFFERIGYRWTGQGMEIKTQIRDITFEDLKGSQYK